MARRLTSFSKIIITVLILALLYFGGSYLLNKTGIGDKIREQADKQEQSRTQRPDNTETKGSSEKSKTASSQDGGLFNKTKGNDSRTGGDDILRVQLVTWGGYAPGLYFNEGHRANVRSRYYTDYGVKVEFTLENDLINALNAWIAGEYDVLVQTADAFPLYTAPKDINDFKPKAFMQVDWSRGGDAIVVKRGINTVNDLKGKRVAVTVPSPSQTLLISTLNAAGLDHTDVTLVKTSDNFKAAELFRNGDIDAAVVWSPDDQIAIQDVPGSKILITTLEQSHIIADIMFAKDEILASKSKQINAFYEGWMKGVAEMKTPANFDKAAKYLAEFNSISVEDAKGAMSTVYWTTHEDNKNFFGLNRNFGGQKGQDLYGKMSKKFVETGDLENSAPNWRSVINTSAIAKAALGAGNEAEKGKVFVKKASDKTAVAIATKPISINFSSGVSTLSENAKTIIDLQFASEARTFQNMKVRIEGNTDNVGSRALNQSLSVKRAQSVAAYLQKAYNMDPNRIVILGNGPDKPVKGCETNATESCKAKNRRTDFQLIAA